MDRREFLGAAGKMGLVLAAATSTRAAGGQNAATAQDPKLQAAGHQDPKQPASAATDRTLRKAVMYGMIGAGATVLERFQILRDCGFEGVEMDSPSDLKPDEVLSAIDKTGIRVHGIVDSKHWQFHLNSPEEAVRTKGREALETAIRDARTYGASSVLLVPAVVNARMPYDDAWRLSMAEIRKVLPLAAECKVRIAIENVWNGFLQSPLEAARYVDELNDPWAAFHFDIGNVINFGWPDQWIRILGQRIVKLHIKDFSRKKRDDEGMWKGFNVELGDGDANWEATMKALDQIGYSNARLADGGGNWATAEVRGGDVTRLREVSTQMDRLFRM